MLFTTIKNLRASGAQQNRVSTVENWLKRQNKEWKAEDKFPVFEISHSNSVDDVEWVFGTRSVLVAWPEMEKAILAEFGHGTIIEHASYVQSQLRASKAKAIAEIAPKYQAAHLKVHQVNSTAASAEPVSALVADSAPSEAMESNLNAATAPAETPTPKSDFALLGAMYMAIGRIMSMKEKSFVDACTYATSPTGSRVFSEYAMSNGADGKEVRNRLKLFLTESSAPA